MAISVHLPLAGEVGEVLLVILAASLAAFLVRFGCLLLRARAPRVQLSSMAPAAQRAGEKTVDPLWVGSLLREQLTALRLSATEAIPDASPGPPLLEIVEGIGEGIGDKSQLGRAVGRLFRAIVPEAAYEVSATMRSTKGEGGTISVQVVDRTHRHRTWVGTGEGRDWNEAAREAAAGVAGALYPQVAYRHKGPWASWRKPVPAELVALNGEARRYEKANRLEQAMGTYLAALDRDPLNPGLRLRIAMLQERLDLYLGAWATYRAIADETHRNSWKGGNRRVRLLALYRMAILLGNKEVAERWVYDTPDPSEGKCKKELREALQAERPVIRASWWNRFRFLAGALPIGFAHTSSSRLLDQELKPADVPGKGGIAWPAVERERRGKWLSEQLGRRKDESPKAAVKRIRRLLEIVSLTHLEQLDTRLRRKPPWRPWRWRDWWRYRPPLRRSLNRRELSLSAVRVSKLVARIRIVASAERRLDAEQDDPQETDRARKRAERARGRLQRRWPFAPKLWRLPARWLRPRHRVADRRDDAWQYHYNAACTVSQALPPKLKSEAAERPPKETRLLDAGIKQLEEYVHRAGGEQVRAQAPWVAREDGDLRALRKTDEYKQWARHHLPKVPKTQRRAAKVDTPRIAARIARHGARTFAERWLTRADGDPVTVDAIAELWQREALAWEALIALFADHPSWEARWKGIATLQTCLRVDGEADIDASHGVDDYEGGDDLTELLNRLSGNGSRRRAEVGLCHVRSWAQEKAASASIATRPGRTKRPRPRSQAHEARQAARIWDRLAEALHEALSDDDEAKQHRLTGECLLAIRTEISPRPREQLPNRSRMLVLSVVDVTRRARSSGPARQGSTP